LAVNSGYPVPVYLLIISVVSVMIAIAVALISLTWFFKDGDDSTRSFENFGNLGGDPYGIFPWLTTKFGLWLVVSGGVGVLCFLVLWRAWQWFHHA
jgi:hypothetical protein